MRIFELLKNFHLTFKSTITLAIAFPHTKIFIYQCSRQMFIFIQIKYTQMVCFTTLKLYPLTAHTRPSAKVYFFPVLRCMCVKYRLARSLTLSTTIYLYYFCFLFLSTLYFATEKCFFFWNKK